MSKEKEVEGGNPYKEFLENYEENNEKTYQKRIKNIIDTEDNNVLQINPTHASFYIEDLQRKMIRDLDNIINKFKEAAEEIIMERRDEEQEIKIRITDIHNKQQIRGIGSEEVGETIKIEGTLSNKSAVGNFAKKIRYKCNACGNEMIREQSAWGKKREPQKCDRMDCGAAKRYIYEDEIIESVDYQTIKIQESPEKLKGGESPREITVLLLGKDLMDKATPGMRVKVIGEVKQVPKEEDEPIYYNILNGHYLETEESHKGELNISQSDEEKIKEIANSGNVKEKIKNSVCPVIHGHDELKLAIGEMLFRGKSVENDGSRLRGYINIGVFGDPGTGKSVIGKYVKNISPRGLYTSGKSSTGAGLTAAAERDEFTGSWSIEAGALVLSDGGSCVIDEFDKMSGKDRSSIHEAMEQGTVSVAKASITTTLQARTSILAIGNPKEGRFEDFQPFADQVNLPATLLSRFDLLFKIVDEPGGDRDEEISEKMLESRDNIEEIEPEIEPELMKKYIAYARENIRPVMTEEAKDKLKSYFMDMREMYNGLDQEKKKVAITRRQLESLIRLSEANARMRLSEEVELRDAKTAISLMDHALNSIGMDPESGDIDIDGWMMGETASQREKVDKIMSFIRERDGAVEFKNIYESCDIDLQGRDELRSLLGKMKDNGDLIELKTGEYKVS